MICEPNPVGHLWLHFDPQLVGGAEKDDAIHVEQVGVSRDGAGAFHGLTPRFLESKRRFCRALGSWCFVLGSRGRVSTV